MKQLFLFLIGVSLFSACCFGESPERVITLVNASAVDAELLEQVRAFAEKELHVPVRVQENQKLAEKKELSTLKEAAVQIKTDADVSLIVLSKIQESDSHLMVYAPEGIAVINVRPLQTPDAEKFARRIERQVMRAAAFVFEMPPTPDPFCVTRDYRSIEDLDRMGRNYSPPWMGRFADEAKKRGLHPIHTKKSRPSALPAVRKQP